MTPSPRETAQALVDILGDVGWEAVGLAKAYLRVISEGPSQRAAQLIYRQSNQHLKADAERIILNLDEQDDFLEHAKSRERTGSAENPITKMFPAAITERRFHERLVALIEERPSLSIGDDRDEGRGLSDFSLLEDGARLPINVKTATTLFRKAEELVGLEPENCVPIPAYKAHGAVESLPDLVYAIAPDWELLNILPDVLEDVFSETESVVWGVLGDHAGSGVRDAEDAFVYQMVDKHWEEISRRVGDPPFYAISAKRAIRILHDKPKRTPGIGVPTWGTGASAEVNVHVSISEETLPWQEVSNRLSNVGVQGVLSDLRRTTEVEIPDPAF